MIRDIVEIRFYLQRLLVKFAFGVWKDQIYVS